MSKENEQQQTETGRVWGVHHRELVPLDLDECVIPPDATKRVVRALRKLQVRKSEVWYVYCESLREWHRVRPGRLFGRRKLDVDEVLAFYRSEGKRLRRRRRKCSVNREYEVWGESEDLRTGKREMVLQGVEKHCFASALHFVNPAEVAKLVEFEVRESFNRLSDDDPPF